MNVIKRNGQLEDFDGEKIYKAIMKAAISEGINDFEDEAREIVEVIEEFLGQESEDEEVSIEEIQDLVEIELYNIGHSPQLAKSYILYRNKKAQDREKNNKFVKIIKDRALIPDNTNQQNNANKDENSFEGRRDEACEEIWKEIGLTDFLPQDIADLHRKGWLYQHDASRIALGESNCLNFSLRYPFEHGFKLRSGELRTPKRFSSACQLVAVIIQSISQHQFGGLAVAAIDRDLAPFAEKSYNEIAEKFKNHPEYIEPDYERELTQGAEALIHNLCSLQSRSGLQLPFSSLNLLTDTTKWGRDVSRAILKAMIKGVGTYFLTPPFPILCAQIKDGINKKPGDPNYDLKLLAIECSTKRLTPNFVNLDSSVCHSDDNNPDTWLTAMGM